MSTIDGIQSNGYQPRATKASSGTTNSSSIDAVFEQENKEVSVDDFLNLMITQLKNQDFMNPMDDTQYVTQLAQFATMQQMQDLAYYSKSNYVMSLVGQDVTVAKLGVGGAVEKSTGPVERVSLYQNEYYIYVGGKSFTLNQLMEVHGKSASDDASDKIDVSEKSIIVGAVTDTTAQVSWPPASEDETLQGKLKYTIYYSQDKNMSTLDDVKQGTVFGEPNRVGLDEDIITGLDPDSVYYVNVVVTDHNGKESIYAQSVIKTKDKQKSAPVEQPTSVPSEPVVPQPNQTEPQQEQNKNPQSESLIIPQETPAAEVEQEVQAPLVDSVPKEQPVDPILPLE